MFVQKKTKKLEIKSIKQDERSKIRHNRYIEKYEMVRFFD